MAAEDGIKAPPAIQDKLRKLGLTRRDDLVLHLLGHGRRHVYLVDYRNNLQIMLYGHIKSDERLRNAVYLFGGKLIYKALSIRLGLPYYDMALFMSMF